VLCPFTAPVIVAWLVEEYEFRVAFLITGVFFLLLAAGSRLWHRLLLPAEPPGEKR